MRRHELLNRVIRDIFIIYQESPGVYCAKFEDGTPEGYKTSSQEDLEAYLKSTYKGCMIRYA